MVEALIAKVVVSLIISVAVSAASSLIASTMAPKATALETARKDINSGESAEPADPLGVAPEPGGPGIGILGARRVGGRLIWQGKSAVDNKTYLVIVLASDVIDGVQTVFMNDIPVGIDGSGNVTTAPWNSTSVNIKIYDGTQTSGADAALKAAFAGWTDDYVGKKTAYVRIALDPSKAGNPFQSGIPDFTFDVRGFKVYDPRDATTKFSSNSALCAAAYLTHELGQKVPSASIDWASVSAAANICDEQVTIKPGGEEARYRCAYVWRTDERHERANAVIGATMAGGAFFVGDKWRIVAAKFDDTGAETITPDTYEAGALEYTEYRPLAEIVNGVRGRFSSPLNSNEMRDFPTYQDAAALVQDGGQEFWLDLDFPAVTSPYQAQRLARVAYLRARYGHSARVETKIDHFDVVANDIVKITDDAAGWNAKTFRVMKESTDSERLAISFDLEHETAAMYAYDSATDEKLYIVEPSLNGGSSGSIGDGYIATRDLIGVPLPGVVFVDGDAGAGCNPQFKVWPPTGCKVHVYFDLQGAAVTSGGINQVTLATGQTTFPATVANSGADVTNRLVKVKAIRDSDSAESAEVTLISGATNGSICYGIWNNRTESGVAGIKRYPAPLPPDVTAADPTTITLNVEQLTGAPTVDTLQLYVNTTNDFSTATLIASGPNTSGGLNHVYTKPGAGQTRYFWGRGRDSATDISYAAHYSPVTIVSFT